MSLTTYWLIGPENTYAQAEGATHRDELVGQGWTVTEEPAPAALVWTRHETTGAYSPLPYGVHEAWRGRGWQLAVPPTRHGEQGWTVALPDRTEQPDREPPAEPADPEPPAAEPPAVMPPADKPQTQKEQRSGR